MGRVIRGQRKGNGGIFKSVSRTRKGAAKLRRFDYSEKKGYVKGVTGLTSKPDYWMFSQWRG